MNIEYEQDNYSVEKAFDIYLAGPANGYTGKKEFKNQSKDGSVKIDFNRLYYIGKKI